MIPFLEASKLSGGLTVVVLVDQLKDSVADFARRHADLTGGLELDLVDNLRKRCGNIKACNVTVIVFVFTNML